MGGWQAFFSPVFVNGLGVLSNPDERILDRVFEPEVFVPRRGSFPRGPLLFFLESFDPPERPSRHNPLNEDFGWEALGASSMCLTLIEMQQTAERFLS